MSNEMLRELSLISQAINPRLNKPIYQRNLTRNKNLPLKKNKHIFNAKRLPTGV